MNAPDFIAPERIYLQPHMWPEVTWAADQIEDSDVEYVRAPAPSEAEGSGAVEGEMARAGFFRWWDKDGSWIDPEPSVDWFDKRQEFALLAFHAGVRFGMAASRNYIADDAVEPREFTFANGRRVRCEDGRLFLADTAPPTANEPTAPSTLAARSEPERRAEPERCERCGQKRESTVHMTEHANAEIRTGAHGFVPAVNRYTLEQVALMLEEEARMGRLPGRAEVAIRWLRARAEERSHEG